MQIFLYDCIYVSDVMVLYAALFENYLPDIPSPSVFNVPSVCKHAMKVINLSHIKFVPDNHIINALNK